MNNHQQPGVPQQPENNGWQQPGHQNPQAPQGHPGYQEQPAYGQPPYPPRADQYNADQYNYNQPPYGQPGPGQFGQTPPKGGFPVWGWVASGVGAVAVLAVAGVMVLGGLGSAKQREALPAPTETAGSSESAEASTEEATTDESSPAATGDEDLYIFQDADFTSPPVWSVQLPAGWTMSDVKDGTTQYRSSDNPCLFSTHQAILPASGGISDEEATKASMQGEIEGIKKAAASPVTVVSDADSVYAKLRNADGHVIEMQEAELRFKNKGNVDLVVRLAVRAVPSANGLMELDLACPANMPTESDLWMELTDSVTMVDDPAV
ncbi:hypothetical protein [Arthrobacter oryzae]|uniref:hypothetical protein n=1 Tax=Arthrobacter oryzae TaxID=409290 RepID=UPI0030CA0492